ncbi:MAG: hypothetical protein JWM97_1188 [Phycisphaerales bacterium]|nr:hypothetical protein [Phycisphaerales bacterium]
MTPWRVGGLIAALFAVFFVSTPLPAAETVRITETSDAIQIDTDALSATVRKSGYVSGIAAASFLDKKTGARDIGFGLHIQDWLMAPGWRDDGYERDAKVHGNLPKHIVEGPQLCTQAKQLPAEILRGEGFAAVRLRYTYTQPGKGFKAGSTWEQTLVFQPGVRYVLSAERITSANDADDLFYRLDMPGHIKHKAGDTFEQVYLSYFDKPIPASEFLKDFAPDEKFLYQRKEGAVPERMIRAYQVKQAGKPGPWLAGMTLKASEVAEAWCHERGYVCFIQELHRKNVKAGESFGAAYVIGWFDDIPSMQDTYDRYKGATQIVVKDGKFEVK